jgi:serine-type D-Ala-D-Ala carboxypeptidase/endopeptidase (penicillin-binding protein 4)
MKKHFRKSAFILFTLSSFLFSGCTTKTASHQTTSMATKPSFVSDFLNNQSLENATVGLLAVDLETGEILVEHHSEKSLVPASVQKLLIAGAMLETFGTGYTFETQLLVKGKVDDAGVLHGDIILEGGGDPAFFSPAFETHYNNLFSDFAQAIKNQNITKVNGNIIGDGSFFGRVPIPGTWIWEDIGNYFGAMPTGLDFAENSYNITFRSGKPGSNTVIVKTEPPMPGIAFENFVTAADNNRDNAYIYGSYLSDHREIRGTIPANRSAFTIRGAMPDPAIVAAQTLFDVLKKSGVEISGEAISNYKLNSNATGNAIAVFPSPPLSELIDRLNLNSVNLYAESFLLHLANYHQKPATISEGSEVLKEFWKARGMNTRGMFLQDGSGLSRANALTAAQLAFLLRYMHADKQLSAAFKQSLPVAGMSGSLKNFGTKKPLKENLKAKTGYMSRVMSFAGYIESSTGKNLSFTIMVNNYTIPNSELRSHIERLLTEIWEAN